MPHFSWDMKRMRVRVPSDCDERDVVALIRQLNGEYAYAQGEGRTLLSRDCVNKWETHEFVPDGATPVTDLPLLSHAELRARSAEARKDYVAFLEPLKRPAFVPNVHKLGDEDEWGKASRYFGRPWMPDDIEWPRLYNGKRMYFVLQLDLATIPWRPEGMPGDGMLLFFMRGGQGALIHVDAKAKGCLRDHPKRRHMLPALCIVDWRETVDVPPYMRSRCIEEFEAFRHIQAFYGSSETSPYSIVADDGHHYTEDGLVAYGARPLAHNFSGPEGPWFRGRARPINILHADLEGWFSRSRRGGHLSPLAPCVFGVG
jgi:hypothetical protein